MTTSSGHISSSNISLHTLTPAGVLSINTEDVRIKPTGGGAAAEAALIAANDHEGMAPPVCLIPFVVTDPAQFMQRATSSPSSPAGLRTGPSAKRQKTAHAGGSPTASTPEGPTNPSRTPAFPSAPTDTAGAQVVDVDLRDAMRDAAVEEEARREAALAKNENASADTRWVLSAAETEESADGNGAGLRVVSWGEGDEDEEAEAWAGRGTGRMRFGAWNAKAVCRLYTRERCLCSLGLTFFAYASVLLL